MADPKNGRYVTYAKLLALLGVLAGAVAAAGGWVYSLHADGVHAGAVTALQFQEYKAGVERSLSRIEATVDNILLEVKK